jgi:heme exporter protein D
MFRPNWPSSGVQVVMVKDSAAHCNAVFFPPIVVASGYFGYVWVSLSCTWLLLVLYGFLVASQQEHSRQPQQQTKQNQKQPRATQGHPNITKITRGNYDRRKGNHHNNLYT